MTTEKDTAPEAMADSDLEEVAGGLVCYQDKSAHKYYRWTTDDRENEKYLCPNCGRPVHYGTGWRYYCDPCDASWLCEWRLTPNLASGLWKEISYWEYQYYEHLNS